MYEGSSIYIMRDPDGSFPEYVVYSGEMLVVEYFKEGLVDF